MNSRECPDIRDAEALLREAESRFPSLESAKTLKEGFALLNDVQEQQDPGGETAAFITNLKIAYTRSILEHLDQIGTRDFEQYVNYFALFLREMAEELGVLRASHPDVAYKLEQARVRFGPQFDELIRALQKSRKPKRRGA